MKTMKIWRNTLVMCAAMLSLASCSSESKDGDWEPMVWKAEVPVQTTDKVYNVSEDGETIIFSCLNYSKPWFSEAEVDGEPILPPYMDKIDYGLIYDESFRAEMHGNKLTVDFKANDSAQPRNTKITVTAGDIFYTFRFKQFAKRDVEEPVEKEVKSEADIEYEQQCPVEKYAIAKGGEYLVDAEGKVTYADGTPTPEFDKDARIYLENILDKSHPLWQAGARYQATYAYVLSPLTDEIRLVPSNRSAILFKNILTESEMAHVQQSMKQGETLHYALILANVYKRGIQKVEFTIKKK